MKLLGWNPWQQEEAPGGRACWVTQQQPSELCPPIVCTLADNRGVGLARSNEISTCNSLPIHSLPTFLPTHSNLCPHQKGLANLWEGWGAFHNFILAGWRKKPEAHFHLWVSCPLFLSLRVIRRWRAAGLSTLVLCVRLGWSDHFFEIFFLVSPGPLEFSVLICARLYFTSFTTVLYKTHQSPPKIYNS